MARGQIDRLLVEGTFKSRKWLFEDNPERGQALLQKVRNESLPVVCICQGNEAPIPMSIVERAHRFFLRRMPNHGSKHNPGCVSYGGINENAKKLYTEEAINEEIDRVRIRLDVPMSEIQGEKFRLETGPAREHASERQRRNTMSMLGLLNYLWEEADLNIWWPAMEGKRYPGLIRSRLMESAQDRLIGKDLPLSSLLFIPRPPRKEEEINNAADLKAHLEGVAGLRGKNETCFGIVVGEISRLIEPTENSRHSGIVMQSMFTAPLWDNHGLIAQLDKRFQNPMQRLRERQRAKEAQKKNADSGAKRPLSLPNDYLLYGMFAVGLSKTGSFVLKHGVVMEMTRRFIPIASHYEGLLESKLHKEQRAFEKPLVYDGERSFFPDFYLLDTDEPKKPALEVYGYSGDEYESRKRQKHVDYVRQRVPYWHWDLKVSQQIPDLSRFPKSVRYFSKST